MKVSVSLPEADVQFLDDYSRQTGLESRSAALHKAVRLLRAAELGTAYAAAWEEWFQSEDSALWETTTGDGLSEP
jgi:Arc/MetJ-type ribon-helix-helix transcriptional regulator